MKTKINACIVVEGKTDIDFLSTFIDSDFYKVNGSAIDKNDIEYLKKIKNKGVKIIILTDPDFPGKKIRQTLNNELKDVYNAYVRKEVSIKHHKVGVAESTKEEVLNALSGAINFISESSIGNLTLNDLMECDLVGENSTLKREKYCNYLKIGHSNSKTLLKKLNLLGYNKEKLMEDMKCLQQTK